VTDLFASLETIADIAIILFSIAGMFYTHKISHECVVYNVTGCNLGVVILYRNIRNFNVIIIIIIIIIICLGQN